MCIYAYACICMHVNIYMYTPVSIHISIYVYTYTHTHTHVYICKYIYIWIYIYVHIHIHTTDAGYRTWNNFECQNFQQVFTGVPVLTNKFSRESPNLHTRLTECIRSPRHSTDLMIKSLDLEIQIHLVWSPPWVACIHIYIYISIYMYTYVYICTYICIYIYT